MKDLEAKWGQVILAEDKIQLPDTDFRDAFYQTRSGIGKLDRIIRTNSILKKDPKVTSLHAKILRALQDFENAMDSKYKWD